MTVDESVLDNEIRVIKKGNLLDVSKKDVECRRSYHAHMSTYQSKQEVSGKHGSKRGLDVAHYSSFTYEYTEFSHVTFDIFFYGFISGVSIYSTIVLVYQGISKDKWILKPLIVLRGY